MPRLTEMDREVESALRDLAAHYGTDAVRRAAKRLPIIRKPPRKRVYQTINDEPELQVMARLVSVGCSVRLAAGAVATTVWSAESLCTLGGLLIPKPNQSRVAIVERLRHKFLKRRQALMAEAEKRQREGVPVPEFEQVIMRMLLRQLDGFEYYDRHDPEWGGAHYTPKWVP
jgi:hypothetical protein